MLKKRLLPLLAAASLCAPFSAYAELAAPGEYLYVLGTPTGWNIDQTNCVLTKEADNVYNGLVYFTPGAEPVLRFYTALGDWEANSIGAVENDEATYFDFQNGNYSGEFVEGKGSWYLDGANGWVDVTVDFNSMQVSFTGINIEHASFISTMINDASVRPNDFDTSAISFDGDLEFVYSVKMSNGRTYDFGAPVIYTANGSGVTGKYSLDAEAPRGFLDIAPSHESLYIMGCTADNAVSLTADFGYMNINVIRSSFNIDDIVFELREDRPTTLQCSSAGIYYPLSAFVNIDPSLDMGRLKVSGDFNYGWEFAGNDCHFTNFDSPGVHTFVITTDELPGKELRLEIEWIPEYPSEFVIYTLDGTNTGLTLSHYKNNIYTSLITIPEGEGDFKFYFKGPEPYADYYVYATNGVTADLSQETSQYEVAPFVNGYYNQALVIPAEFRGNTYMFRFEPSFEPNASVLEISHEGYERPVTFEWAEEFDGYEIRAGEFFDFNNLYYRLRLDPSISREDLIFSVEPGDIAGLDIYDYGISISRDYSGPETLTIRVTTAELMEKGISLTKDLRISAAYPAEWVFVSGGERIGELALYPTEEFGVYANTITIPEGEGDFRFRFSDATLSDRYNFGSGETADLSTGFYKGYIRPWDGNEMTIPAEYRGRTYVFQLNCPEERISIYEEGVDPESITVELAEGFPEFVTARKETHLYFTIKGANIANINCFIDNNDNAELNWWDLPQNENGTASFVADIWSPESRPGYFTIHIGKYINGEFREYFSHSMEVRFTAIESISAPESIVIREGEFANVAYDVFPADNSMDTYRTTENPEIAEHIDYGYNSFYILGKQAGTTKVSIVATNWNEYHVEMAVVAVTVLPKETSVGEHIFHANLAIGDELKLNVSDHGARSYAEGITWTSSDPEIVTVDEEGNVKAVDNGVAVITADCGEHQVYMGIVSGEGYTGVENPDTELIRAYGRNGMLYIVGAPEGSDIRVFDASGKARASKKATGITNKMNVGTGIYVVSVADKVFKLSM